jgi:Protein of unknown function (DUF3027).
VPLVVLEGDDAVVDWFDPEADDADAGPAEPGELPAPGRSRVLSAIGRDGASERWYTSEHGPRSPIAHAAARALCQLRLFPPAERGARPLLRRLRERVRAGRRPGRVGRPRLRGAFRGHGRRRGRQGRGPVIDEFGYDLVELPGVSVEETVFEPLSRGAD